MCPAKHIRFCTTAVTPDINFTPPAVCVMSLQMCLVHKAGSLSVVEYGSNDVLATCRTEHMSPYLLSAAEVEARGTSAAVKRVAYLLDLQTIRVIDLLTGGQSLVTISHDAKIVWLVSFDQLSCSLGPNLAVSRP